MLTESAQRSHYLRMVADACALLYCHDVREWAEGGHPPILTAYEAAEAFQLALDDEFQCKKCCADVGGIFFITLDRYSIAANYKYLRDWRPYT